MQLPTFKHLRPDTAIYLYYAGRDRKYMALSRATERVFLDIPGFLTDEHTFDDEASMIQRLNRATAVKRNLRYPESYPAARELSAFEKTPPTINGFVDRSFAADLGNIRTMFIDMVPGDIVIMTPLNHYDNLLIGEVDEPWHESQVMMLPEQGNNPLPFRSVKWLSHGLTRRDFPADIARRMQNRKAITKIDEDYYENIFKLVYHAYIWGNISKLDIFAPNYNSNDPTATQEASFLIKYAVAFYVASLRGETELFNDLSLEEAAERYFDASVVEQIAQSFGSPGGYIARLIGPAAAGTVAVILAIALSPETQPTTVVQANLTTQIQHSSSGGTADHYSVRGITDSLRAGRTEELREKYGRKARSKLGLTLTGSKSPELTARDRIRD